MDIDYDEAIRLQGSWGHSPTTPLVDPQAEDTTHTQSNLYQMATSTVQGNCDSRRNTAEK